MYQEFTDTVIDGSGAGTFSITITLPDSRSKTKTANFDDGVTLHYARKVIDQMILAINEEFQKERQVEKSIRRHERSNSQRPASPKAE